MKKPAVVIRNLQNRVYVDQRQIKKIVYSILSLEAPKKTGVISISLVDDKTIKTLNLKYLGRKSPTDVLAFDLSRVKNDLSCEIVVSSDTAFYNSRIYKTTPVYEAYLYVIHGLLHILGYDDRTSSERKFMQGKAEQILSILNT